MAHLAAGLERLRTAPVPLKAGGQYPDHYDNETATSQESRDAHYPE
jgi:hypothetical protein